jgi:membrane protease YdiL (CAAX protease family)
MTDWIRRYPLASYYALAFGLSVTLGLLLTVSLLFGLLALFGPAAAAFIVAWVSEGRVGVMRLRAATTRWRVRPLWYVAAIGLPLLSYAVAYVVYVIAGNPAPSIPGQIEPIAFVIFFLVIGEEIGWRGFLLPGLLRSRSPLVATTIVALAWIFWHSPLYFVPGMPSYGGPFLLPPVVPPDVRVARDGECVARDAHARHGQPRSGIPLPGHGNPNGLSLRWHRIRDRRGGRGSSVMVAVHHEASTPAEPWLGAGRYSIEDRSEEMEGSLG